ncbi:hypothetical protein K2173_001911 [Erythroxylum novogranatense]|uniref:MPN domain-containing protein n=1 Tax=Erythroxylum novogranatense TaxID=1862640 RepID=A0AAV8SPM4_9ROSI|nr:hypothetical protein K2173_001911 [Erythroxylum novogranatense]
MSGMERLQWMFAGVGGALGHPPPDSLTLDSSEQVYISSLALLKMLKHDTVLNYLCFVRRAGVPMEVMGLMLGEFVDEYTVCVVNVFTMPQSGRGVSVEAVDHVFQTNMLDMLKQIGCNVITDPGTVPILYQLRKCCSLMAFVCCCCRPEMVVGWYQSHPGFGCWLSGVDINTQQSFEALNQRDVAVVVDPIQSGYALLHQMEPYISQVGMACVDNKGLITTSREETTGWFGKYAIRFDGTLLI